MDTPEESSFPKTTEDKKQLLEILKEISGFKETEKQLEESLANVPQGAVRVYYDNIYENNFVIDNIFSDNIWGDETQKFKGRNR